MGLEDVAKQAKWPAWTIQLSILTIDTSLILAKMVNSCVLLSLMLILTLFALQAMSKRFLFLYPVNNGRRTPQADTYILRTLLLFSALFLFLGVLKTLPEDVIDVRTGDSWLIPLLPVLAVLGMGVFPLCFWICGTEAIRRRVVAQLQTQPKEYRIKCPSCGKFGATERRQVISGQEIQRTITVCDNCRQEDPQRQAIFPWNEYADIG
jgi:hypothetical protein